MSTLTGNKISLTYKSLFKTADNDVLTATLKQMSDGLGNNSGVYLNTGGDLKTTGILEFANFKGTSTAVTINKLVNEADGISNNDNDTSLPTSAAVKNYVDTHVTSQDLDFKGDSGTGAVDLDSQLLDIAGTTNEIVTSASAQKLTIGLPNSVTISGTYTGATFSGDLNGTINTATSATTQNAGTSNQTVATTKFVMDLDSASDLDFSGTTGTGDVNLNTQTFAVSGTANQITTAASNQGLQISLLSTGVTMPNGSVATTQSAGDNSTKLATTAYVDVLDSASDLDITDGTNTSDVNLNTQSLSILGTANEIVSTVSAQTATISLPSTINVNVTGNVTGNLTGNADTATKWQTARNLSLSGEATGTIASVDGSVAVSGAVTLTNSAVVAKVLTGLPTPAAGNINANDTILEAFGKLQSQISTISSGLVFKGSWDADTNTPTLVSGGGEVDSGTTTSQATNRLIQTGQNFNTTVSVDDKVINQTDGTTALVTVIASNTELVLDADIMLNNEAYTIDASPFISQGEYYVINVAGNTNLNGITDWAIGDWVIADADNRWSKLDHSQIDGGGSLNSLPVFTSSNTIGDSIVAQAGTALTITGSATTTLGLSSTGNFAVNTNKFTANATTGNTAFSGDLAINTNKFTVNATSGNTLVAGTLNSGAITSTGNITVPNGLISTISTNNLTISGSVAEHAGLSFATNSVLPVVVSAETNNVVDLGQNGNAFKNLYLGSEIISEGGATFGGNVDINGGLTISPNTAGKDTFTFTTNSSNDGRLLIKSVDTVKVDIQANGNSYFNGGNIGLGTTTPAYQMTLSVNSSFHEAGLNTVLNGGGANQELRIISDAHGAGGRTGDITFYTANSATATERMKIDSSGNVGIGTDSPDCKLHIAESTNNSGSVGALANGGLQVENTNTTANSWSQLHLKSVAYDAHLRLLNNGLLKIMTDGNVDAMSITDAGKVGIGTDSPAALLTIKGTGDAIRVESTNTGAGGAQIDLLHFTTNPVDNDTFGLINMGGYYTGTTSVYGTSIKSIWTDVSARNAALTFSTNNAGTLSERMRIDSSGNVIIGNTAINGSFGASNTVLTVKGNSTGGEGIVQISGLAGNAGDNVSRISFFSQAETNPLAEIRAVRGNSDTNGRLEQYTANILRDRLDENGAYDFQGAEAGVTGIRFQGSGTCNGYSGSMASFYVMDVMRDQGSGKSMNVQGTIDIAAGYGIGFGAASGSGATGTLLNDYEEGTWTPTAYYQDSTDQANVTYTTQNGTYTKVGNLVTVHIYLVFNQGSGAPANDNIGIAGFPFRGTDALDLGAGTLMFSKGQTQPYFLRHPSSNGTLALLFNYNLDGNQGNDVGNGAHTFATSFTYKTDQ